MATAAQRNRNNIPHKNPSINDPILLRLTSIFIRPFIIVIKFTPFRYLTFIVINVHCDQLVMVATVEMHPVLVICRQREMAERTAQTITYQNDFHC